jgi:DNA polymerase III epsilon subunit-like protein
MIVTIFDTETTGLPKSLIMTNEMLHLWPYIVQFSYIVYDTDEKKILEIRDYIIKIPVDIVISTESTNIHGITNEITEKNGVEINGVLTEFIEWCDKSDLIVAHNVEFDYKMVSVEFMRLINNVSASYDNFYKKFKYYKKFLCTMKTSVELCNIKAVSRQGKEYVKFPTLLELHKHLFVYEPKNLHNSMNDVLVCLRCFYKIKFGSDLLADNTTFQALMYNIVVI